MSRGRRRLMERRETPGILKSQKQRKRFNLYFVCFHACDLHLLPFLAFLSKAFSFSHFSLQNPKMEYFLTRIPDPESVRKMADGSKVETVVVSASDHDTIHLHLQLLTVYIQDDKDAIVGFDTEWSLAQQSPGSKVEARTTLIKLGTRYGCLLVTLEPLDRKLTDKPMSAILNKFLMNKDIIFVGVHIKQDLEKLKRDFGIEVRNAVELSELAANVLREPRLLAYSIRGLAREVLATAGWEKGFECDVVAELGWGLSY
ncbi:Werner syndrome-like exonuclease-like protein [Quillaja saponaria]|uniref:Werner syndrome-like exonuclease-like protein n=1 Tax=Quillaja saponaria TaxID=32244 RepID=A0AAD7QBB7_QUISA|nr:Werner syndrome-like exonuclease-like protein [Quillaja saponaria]KAJ7978155.1 Werner syndrome-like exonuclease-like protein [Quillaja saponaria]